MSECPVNKLLAEAEGDLRAADAAAETSLEATLRAIVDTVIIYNNRSYVRGRRDAIAEAQAVRDAEED